MSVPRARYSYIVCCIPLFLLSYLLLYRTSCLGQTAATGRTYYFTYLLDSGNDKANASYRARSSEEVVERRETTLRPGVRKITKPQYNAFSTAAPAPDTMLSFQRTAFVIAGKANEKGAIRVTSVQPCHSKRSTQLRLANRTYTLQKTTIHENCPWFFAPKCTNVGYYGAATSVELPVPLPPVAQIKDHTDTWVDIELVDARPPEKKPHRLGVCLQPIYLMADWPLIPQFFESWIANGATVFFIYVQSTSLEVDILLRLYESQTDITVIRVPWAPFPTNRSDSDPYNPNNRIYRTEVLTGVNDCVLRARAYAEFVVSSDLDEIIAPKKPEKETLLHILDEYKRQPVTGQKTPVAFSFLHSYAYVNSDYDQLSHPSQLHFDFYNKVHIEKKVWENGFRSKIIMIPEQIYRAHVHTVIGYEYARRELLIIPHKRAQVLHFRRVRNAYMQDTNDTVTASSLLADANQRWTSGYKKRMDAAMAAPDATGGSGGNNSLTLHTERWPNRGMKIMEEIEHCRDVNYEASKTHCQTEWKCRSDMKSIDKDEWIMADNRWIIA